MVNGAGTRPAGWAVAMGIMVLGAAGVAVASAGLFAALSPLTGRAPEHWGVCLAVGLAAVGLGWPFGSVLARKMRGASALGWALVLPVIVALAGAQLAAYRAAEALCGEQAPLIMAASVGIGAGSALAAAKTLLGR